MYNNDTELLFPSRVIADLREERDQEWQALVEKAIADEETGMDLLAFVLMMARLNSCHTCNADSFRAMRGCTNCSQQNVRRYRENDKGLVKMYDKAYKDLEKKLKK